jgi:hypothetical protein
VRRKLDSNTDLNNIRQLKTLQDLTKKFKAKADMPSAKPHDHAGWFAMSHALWRD